VQPYYRRRALVVALLRNDGAALVVSSILLDHTADSNNKAEVEISVLDARTHGAWNDYPVNELRYLALSRVSTTHILYLDVDFWPCDFLYETLMGCQEEDTLTPVREALFSDPKQALVIPAFQLWRRCSEWTCFATRCDDTGWILAITSYGMGLRTVLVLTQFVYV